MVLASSGDDCRFLQQPHPWRRLTRVKNLRARSLDGLHIARGGCRNAAQVGEQVERAALTTDHSPGIAADTQHRPVLAPEPLFAELRELGRWIERAEDCLGGFDPKDHSGSLLRNDSCSRAASRHRR